MASPNPSAKSLARKTSLYIQIDASLNISRKEFLQNLEQCLKLTKRNVQVKLLIFRSSGQFIEAKVEFPSIQKAKKSLRNIQKAPTNSFTVSMVGFKTDTLVTQIQRLSRMIKSKQTLCCKHHKEKIVLVEAELHAAKAKNVDISLISKQIQCREALKARRKELEKQRKEYIQACDQMHTKLEHLRDSIYNSRKPIKQKIMSIQTEFARESSKFQTALPIYARRQEIVECIKSSQVSVVIGETGSGKSTQLVQYLHDAGFAKHQLIACTQPRKVAASSLAEHVSEEMCCAKNSLVVAKLTSSQKLKDGAAKIVYLTDHVLLNECIQDRTFSKYSCIIIDEAHERSLHTDILLAFIKQCLPLRPDLKIIITSATIDPELFVKYFSTHPIAPPPPIVRVSGRTYPVDVNWCPLRKPKESLRYPNMPYVEEAIQCVIDIHNSSEEGAILVFLTSLFEIEVACNMMSEKLNKSKAVVLPLHGRLQPADQKKVFQLYKGKRKIVFSTNVAETSITIPDVKYIVDSGYAKEMCFDPKRNMNSLEVRRISKSSAEQRKGRAGRVSAGICYRLYSEKDYYEDMPDRGLPEILRVHLTHAVLKLFEFGVIDVECFDFVEMPDVTSLRAAVKMLKFLGAFNADGTDGKLSETGKKLALFPIDPQLGKIVLDAIDEKVVLEAVVAVAISSIGGNIFYRGQTDEVKAEGDKQKLKFVHQGGDHLTALNVYKDWVVIKKENRNKWCVANSINAKSMRLVEETVKEIFHILSTQLNIPHSHIKTPNIDTAGNKIVKLYFRTFIWNLAVNIGHKRMGYMCFESPDEQLALFPGSSPMQLNDVPQYLMYEKTLKLTQQFLLQVIPVEKEWIDEALADGLLTQDVFQKVKNCRVQEYVIANLGSEVLKRSMKKKKELIEGMKVECDDWRVELDFSIERGQAILYCQAKSAEILKHHLTQKFNLIKDELKAETAEMGITKPDDEVKLVLGNGGCVQFVLMPFDFHTILIKGPVNDNWTEATQEALLEHGKLESYMKKQLPMETRVYAKFLNPQDAEKALKCTFLPDCISLQPQLNRDRGEKGVKLFKLQVDWTRRKRHPVKSFAFVKFDNEDDLDDASEKLCDRSISVGFNRHVEFQPDEKQPNSQLFIPAVPMSVTEEQVKVEILRKLPEGINIDVNFPREKPFPTTQHQLDALKQQLQDIVLKYATKGQFTIKIGTPEDKYYTYRSYINFNDPEEGQQALNHLEDENIGGERLQVQLLLSSTTRLSNEVYEVVKSDLEYISKNLPRTAKLKIYKDFPVKNLPNKKNWTVDISSGDLAVFITVKKCINAFLQPHVFECDSKFLSEYTLSKEFRSELDTIEKDTKTVILQNHRSMSLCIYGETVNQEEAEQSLRQKIEDFKRNGLKVYEIDLKKPGMPRGVMRHLIQVFKVDLSGIFKIGGQIRKASLNPRRQILTVLSDDNGLQSIDTIINDYGKAINIPVKGEHNDTATVDEFECCVCFTEIDDLKDVFRLECCGHTYHYDCIKLQLSPNNITMPVVCASEECSLPFVWQDFKNLMKEKALSLYQLVNSSVKVYLAANQDKVHNCPTPDCSMIYKVAEKDGIRFICDECGSHICTKCHVQFHDGLSCKMYEAGKNGDEELTEWLQGDSNMRKRCPNCDIPIEKSDGCNHMTCMQCKVHICWVCCKHFDTVRKCYRHLFREHGSFV